MWVLLVGGAKDPDVLTFETVTDAEDFRRELAACGLDVRLESVIADPGAYLSEMREIHLLDAAPRPDPAWEAWRKLANRIERHIRLQEIGAPLVVQASEEELIFRARTDLLALGIDPDGDPGTLEAHRAEVRRMQAAREQERER